jgi:hypothetical protein
MSLFAHDIGPGDLVQPLWGYGEGYKLVLEVEALPRGMQQKLALGARVKVLHESGRITMFFASKLKIIQKAPESCAKPSIPVVQ